MLAVGRDITPLPSVPSSRTTTRRDSLVPDSSNPETIKQFCDRLDARLATAVYTGGQHAGNPDMCGYSYDPSSNSPPMSPTLPSGFDLKQSENSSLICRSTIASTVKSQRRPQLSNVMSWTSKATRRAEYEKIDRAHTGARGFVRRVWPQCLRKKDGREAFFTGECDGNSVRRFRMDVSEDDSEEEDKYQYPTGDDPFDEKHALKKVIAGIEVESRGTYIENRPGKVPQTKKQWWSCFDQ